MRSAEPCFGTWLSLGSPIVAEMAAQCGFDWLLMDLEHGAMTEADLLPMLQATAAWPVAVIVRVPSHEPTRIARALDWGAAGIMAPHVSSAEEARALVRALRYPPVGIRGYSRTVRVHGFGLRPPDDTPPLLFAQIECVEGLENSDAIAAVEGVDVLFVGPADLQLSLATTPGQPWSYEDALDRVAEAARRHNRSSGLLIRNSDETPGLLEKGFTKVALGSDMSLLRAAFLNTTSTTKMGCPAD